jgi:hypothetical protein
MTQVWIMRRCDSCGVLESDRDAEFVVERRIGDVDRVVHLVGGGLRQCGVLVVVDEAVT